MRVIVMIMVAVDMIRMIVRSMIMHMPNIGAAFRLKRRLDRRHLAANLDDQCQHVGVFVQTNTVWEKLRRYVAVAQCPRDARQHRVISTHFDQRLWCCNHIDKAAIVQR